MKAGIKLIGCMLLVLFVLTLMAACKLEPDRVTKENYDKLKLGMSYEEVSEILGLPADTSTRFGLKQYTWVEEDRHIHAKFLADNAVYYSSRNLKKSPSPKGTKKPTR